MQENHKIPVVDDDMPARALERYLTEQGFVFAALPTLSKWIAC